MVLVKVSGLGLGSGGRSWASCVPRFGVQVQTTAIEESENVEMMLMSSLGFKGGTVLYGSHSI